MDTARQGIYGHSILRCGEVLIGQAFTMSGGVKAEGRCRSDIPADAFELRFLSESNIAFCDKRYPGWREGEKQRLR